MSFSSIASVSTLLVLNIDLYFFTHSVLPHVSLYCLFTFLSEVYNNYRGLVLIPFDFDFLTLSPCHPVTRSSHLPLSLPQSIRGFG